MSQWFRFYESALDDPKVQRLTGETFKGWINLLCLAKRHDGRLPPHKDIAFALRKSDSETTKLLDALVSGGLLDHDDNGVTPHNWNARQYKSDVSNDRVKRYRERQRNVTVTPSDTDTDTDTDTEAEKKERANALGGQDGEGNKEIVHAGGLLVSAGNAEDGDTLASARAAWNATAAKYDWSTVQRFSPQRQKALAARLAEIGGLDGWTVMLGKLEESPFFRERWAPSFDWILKPANLTKIMEGNYDRKSAGASSPNGRSVNSAFADAAAMLRGKQYNGL